jgi:hypothetical protein
VKSCAHVTRLALENGQSKPFERANRALVAIVSTLTTPMQRQGLSDTPKPLSRFRVTCEGLNASLNKRALSRKFASPHGDSGSPLVSMGFFPTKCLNGALCLGRVRFDHFGALTLYRTTKHTQVWFAFCASALCDGFSGQCNDLLPYQLTVP